MPALQMVKTMVAKINELYKIARKEGLEKGMQIGEPDVSLLG